MTKAFWKSKRFYGFLSTEILLIGDMVVNGVSLEKVMGVLAAGFAFYGGIVAQGPLTATAKPELKWNQDSGR